MHLRSNYDVVDSVRYCTLLSRQETYNDSNITLAIFATFIGKTLVTSTIRHYVRSSNTGIVRFSSSLRSVVCLYTKIRSTHFLPQNVLSALSLITYNSNSLTTIPKQYTALSLDSLDWPLVLHCFMSMFPLSHLLRDLMLSAPSHCSPRLPALRQLVRASAISTHGSFPSLRSTMQISF